MLLAIDAGNTNTVFALYDEGTQRGLWRCATDARRTADEYAVWLLQLMQLKGFRQDQITAAILASVVPAATFNLRRLCEQVFNCPTQIIGSADVDLGLQVLVDSPKEVGADRLVNAVAALEQHSPPLIIVDFGTATTFDVVNSEGAYVGGVIAPGINLSMDALHRAAAQLPRVDVVRPPQVIGTNTVTAMQSGVFWGYVGLIEGLIARISAELDGRPTVLATGGLAGLFSQSTPLIEHIDGDLTLTGLFLIHQRNRTS